MNLAVVRMSTQSAYRSSHLRWVIVASDGAIPKRIRKLHHMSVNQDELGMEVSGMYWREISHVMSQMWRLVTDIFWEVSKVDVNWPCRCSSELGKPSGIQVGKHWKNNILSMWVIWIRGDVLDLLVCFNHFVRCMCFSIETDRHRTL